MKSIYVFDAYGTLFDVHAAVREYANVLGPDHALLSEVWRNKQLEFTWTRTLMNQYIDFWEITQQALDYAFAKTPSAKPEHRQALLDAYWQLDCFAEVPHVLKQLKQQRAQTAILSNGSPDMLNAAVQSSNLQDVIDCVLSVDTIKQFKAVPAVYQMVLDAFGVSAEQVSFHSSNRWDVAASKKFGFRTIWCNRSTQPDEYLDLAADLVLNDLNGLIDEKGKPV